MEVVRDPLWSNIRVEPELLAVIDTAVVQRLRYVRQLGHAFLVYPGATHTRFEHALGTYHLAQRALAHLGEVAGGTAVSPDDGPLVRVAALLHDIGHYPFSHALEEAGLPRHEALAERRLADPALAAALERVGIRPERLLPLIRGTSDAPLAGLVSGSVDVDKLDYLSRDAMMCGVPYGVIDVERLLASLTLADGAGPGGRAGLALHEKGLAALESLLFAKYQMYRNVYWHHAVRSATAMFKRLVRTAIAAGSLRADEVAIATDDGFSHDLQGTDATGLAAALRARRLAKRAVEVPAHDLPPDPAAWPAADPDLLARVEDRLAREAGLQPGELLLDFPAKPDLLQVDLPLVQRDGRLRRDPPLHGVAAELHRAARHLRVFVLRPAVIPARAVVELVMQPADAVAARLADGRPLLSRGGP